MTTLKHTIEINRALRDVYALARQVERYPEFMKDYLSSKIVEHRPDGDLVERSAIVKGKFYTWKSLVTFQKNEGVYFVHQEGPLHGMQVSWRFEALTPDRTRLSITHHLQVRRAVPFLGWVLERVYYAPNIGDIASRVVVAFKAACESLPAETAARQPVGMV